MNITLKNILIKFCILFFAALISEGCNRPESDKKEQEKKGEIDRESMGKKEPPRLVYDSLGNIIERHSISYRQKDNSIRSRDSYYYKYDTRKNVIEETKISHDESGNQVFKNVNFYYFNDLNQKAEQKFFSYDASDSLTQQARNTYSYDKSGNLLQEKTWFADGSVKSIINSFRDNTGYLTAEEYINFNPDGSKRDHKKFHYSKYGLEKTEDLMKE